MRSALNFLTCQGLINIICGNLIQTSRNQIEKDLSLTELELPLKILFSISMIPPQRDISVSHKFLLEKQKFHF